MVDRQNRIITAHESTFRWVFHDDPSQVPQPQTKRWSSLREWLSSNEQLYWITGKAGSGKSTLMKFLCSPTAEMLHTGDTQKKPDLGVVRGQSRCHPHLQNWAGTSGLVVASFYFWNSGMELQMSQMGLLRTLLCQIVTQRPEILPVVSPKEWESVCLFDHRIESWFLGDLHRMLFQAVKALKNDSKVLFFIDGLDEFDGNHEKLITLVRKLMQNNSHVKFCVASRPWNIFQDAFGKEANLRLEDLTFNDIKDFVRSKFNADAEFENLRRRYPSFADKLMNNIVVKASGVFLWVDLVVRSLLSGMRLGDRIEDFQRRLDELPPDLEMLYEKILHSLDPFYLEHAAQYFTLVESAKGPLTILQFSFADEESPESAIKMRLGPMDQNELSLRIEAMNRRLNSRCKGFLEAERGLQSMQGTDKRPPEQLTVQYLHRTVRDFIKSPKAHKFLQASANRGFDPSLQLCVAYLMYAKTQGVSRVSPNWPDVEEYINPTVTNAIRCIESAASVAKPNEGGMIALLNELEAFILGLYHKLPLIKQSEYMSVWGDIAECGSAITQADCLLNLAVIHGVVPYVRPRLARGGLLHLPVRYDMMMPHERAWSLLLCALSLDVPEPAMVKCLLDLGADPNFKPTSSNLETPWTRALTKVTILYTIQMTVSDSAEYSIAEEKWKQTLRLMLSRADCTQVPESRLSPISRKMLKELRDEAGPKEQNKSGLTSWLRAWK
jgi:hypothetical protein